MRAKDKERQEFIDRMLANFTGAPSQTKRVAELLLRHAKTHGRLAEMSCNGHPAQGSPTMPAEQINKLQDKWDAYIEKRETQIEHRMKQLADSIGCQIKFGGDPRGYTVKVVLPDGRYNTWGGAEEGWGIPQ